MLRRIIRMHFSGTELFIKNAWNGVNAPKTRHKNFTTSTLQKVSSPLSLNKIPYLPFIQSFEQAPVEFFLRDQFSVGFAVISAWFFYPKRFDQDLHKSWNVQVHSRTTSRSNTFPCCFRLLILENLNTGLFIILLITVWPNKYAKPCTEHNSL